jgi:hypothetical protein
MLAMRCSCRARNLDGLGAEGFLAPPAPLPRPPLRALCKAFLQHAAAQCQFLYKNLLTLNGLVAKFSIPEL